MMNRTRTFATSEAARLQREAADWTKLAQREDGIDVPLGDMIFAAGDDDSRQSRAVRDASARTADRYQIELAPRQVALPWELLAARDLQIATGAGGGFLQATAVGPAAQALRGPSACVGRLGVPVVEDARTTAWPQVITPITATWLTTEATAAAESDPAFALRAGGRFTVASTTDLSKSLERLQPAAQAVVGMEKLAALAQRIDAAIIAGTGTGGQPQGIIGTAGVLTQSGTTLQRAGLLAAQRQIIRAGLRSPDAFAALTTPEVGELLGGRIATGGNDPLWTGPLHEGALLGLRAVSSENVPAASMLMGDWRNGVVLHVMGPAIVEVNGFEPTKFRAGIMEVRIMATINVAVLAPGGFLQITSIT
jgi:HK97 family phage major capsid protein